jgi:tripartite ATP-independent transporter DctP family solute receptor
MKRITALVLALLLLASVIPLFAGGGQQSGGATRQRVLRLADNQPDGYPTVLGDLAFARYVEEHTNGAIKIEVYNNSVLGQERETIEMTQTGAIAFIRVGINPLTSINPQMAALGMPFLYRDREHMFKVLDGPIGQEIMESLQRQNLLGLCWFDAGFRNFYNSQREIRSPADMVGLKIRVQESALMMDMVSFLGASPTPMAYGEVYTGIQNGVIDGAENNWPSYITAGHYEVAKYFTSNQHMASPEMILVNTGVWNSFSEEEKRIVRAGAAEGARVEREEWLKAEREYEAQARAAGSIITDLTPAQHQLFVDALAPLYEQPAYTGFRDLIARIRAVQ